jgi:hypothetical protein
MGQYARANARKVPQSQIKQGHGARARERADRRAAGDHLIATATNAAPLRTTRNPVVIATTIAISRTWPRSQTRQLGTTASIVTTSARKSSQTAQFDTEASVSHGSPGVVSSTAMIADHAQRGGQHGPLEAPLDPLAALVHGV